MAVMTSGLGGAAGYGENSFRNSTISGDLDDGFTQVNISSVFGAEGIIVNGTTYNSIFISTNGLITFDSGETAFSPAPLQTLGQPVMAPFWADGDLNRGGDIYWDLDPVSGKVTITWVGVAASNAGVSGTNSFQVELTRLGSGEFDVRYIYGNIDYANGFNTGTGANAVAGFYDGTTQYLLPGAGVAATLVEYENIDFGTDGSGIFSFGSRGAGSFRGDGIVEGTAGSNLIDSSYTTDPEGDRIDDWDATGYAGTQGQDDYVLAGAGNDTVLSGLGNDQVFGGSGNDSIQAGHGNDTVDGGTENDWINGGSGDDSLLGGDGNDTIFGGVDTAAVNYTPAFVEITTANQSVTGTGGRSNFSVRSVSNENNLTTGNANGLSGFQLGNSDSNETHTHATSNWVSGGQIRFTGVNGTEAVTIKIDGQSIDLNAAISSGLITFVGGGAYSVNASGQIIRTGNAAPSAAVGTLTINGPYQTVGLTLTGTVSNGNAGMVYEYFVNTQPVNVTAQTGGNDTIHAGSGNDVVDAGNGNDLVYGELGDDSILGGAGNDSLFGGDGQDSLDGGANNDSLNGGIGNDSLVGGAGNDRLEGEAGNDTLHGDAGLDSLYGGADNDQLYGGDGDDLIEGGSGADGLYGGLGNDTISGGLGNDVIDGGVGNDLIFGNEGDDTVYGDLGDDTIQSGIDAIYAYGGQDNDRFVIDLGTSGGAVDGGENSGDNDVLDLTAHGWAGVNIVYAPGNPEAGTVQFLDGLGVVVSSMTFTGIEDVIVCFTPGTRILTRRGEVTVEALKKGDMVMTRDNGSQPLRWVGRKDLSIADLIVQPALRPVRIRAGALGCGLPLRDMKVSPQHRMLLAGARSEMLFGEEEVLVAATHLTCLPGVEQVLTSGISYIHLMFDRHEIICADGTWSESYQPAARTVDAMVEAQRQEIEALFPEISGAPAYTAARPTLRAHEARVLLADAMASV